MTDQVASQLARLLEIGKTATLLSQRASVRFRTLNPVSGRGAAAPIFRLHGKALVFMVLAKR